MSAFVHGLEIDGSGEEVRATIRITDPANHYASPSPTLLPASFRKALREWLDSE